MYIVDGIAYVSDSKPTLTVCGVRPMDDYKLWVRFNTGEAKLFDCSVLFNKPLFQPLTDKVAFSHVYIDYGALTWLDGSIDISPEFVYENGVNADENESA